jgi:hypothetical protein
MVTRVAETGQPLHVGHEHLVGRVHEPVAPTDLFAGLLGEREGLCVGGRDMLGRPAVDHDAGAVGQAGEEVWDVRAVPSLPPRETKGLRGKADDLGVKVQQHCVVRFEPRFVTDVAPLRGRPPQAREVPLAPERWEGPDRLRCLQGSVCRCRVERRPSFGPDP